MTKCIRCYPISTVPLFAHVFRVSLWYTQHSAGWFTTHYRAYIHKQYATAWGWILFANVTFFRTPRWCPMCIETPLATERPDDRHRSVQPTDTPYLRRTKEVVGCHGYTRPSHTHRHAMSAWRVNCMNEKRNFHSDMPLIEFSVWKEAIFRKWDRWKIGVLQYIHL